MIRCDDYIVCALRGHTLLVHAGIMGLEDFSAIPLSSRAALVEPM